MALMARPLVILDLSGSVTVDLSLSAWPPIGVAELASIRSDTQGSSRPRSS
jgi:hypothetical protein